MLSFLIIPVFYYASIFLTVSCTSEDGNSNQSGSHQGPKTTHAVEIPDLNLPAQSEKSIYHSKEQRAIRLGQKLYKYEYEKYPSLDHAISEANSRITAQVRQYSADARERKKTLGLKVKDYHKLDYYKSRRRLTRQTNDILKDKNNEITDRNEAMQLANQYIKAGTSYRRAMRSERTKNKQTGKSTQ